MTAHVALRCAYLPMPPGRPLRISRVWCDMCRYPPPPPQPLLLPLFVPPESVSFFVSLSPGPISCLISVCASPPSVLCVYLKHEQPPPPPQPQLQPHSTHTPARAFMLCKTLFPPIFAACLRSFFVVVGSPQRDGDVAVDGGASLTSHTERRRQPASWDIQYTCVLLIHDPQIELKEGCLCERGFHLYYTHRGAARPHIMQKCMGPLCIVISPIKLFIILLMVRASRAVASIGTLAMTYVGRKEPSKCINCR